MKIKAFLLVYSTKSDIYGNRYHAARIINPRTGESVTVKTCSGGNARYVVGQLVGGCVFDETIETCSARLNSLPDYEYMDIAALASALRRIGYSIPQKRVEKVNGCL